MDAVQHGSWAASALVNGHDYIAEPTRSGSGPVVLVVIAVVVLMVVLWLTTRVAEGAAHLVESVIGVAVKIGVVILAGGVIAVLGLSIYAAHAMGTVAGR